MGARGRPGTITKIDAKKLSLTHSRFAFAYLLYFVCGNVNADGAAALDQDDELSEIIVTATRLEQAPSSIPTSISVVSGDLVQFARQQLGLDEALAAVPGVFFQNRYNFAQDLRIAIRGFGARSNFGVRGIKILIDDIPETLADGQSQVEVLRGPASAMYGNAAGGVINTQSESGGTIPYVEARVAAGDFGYRKHQLKTGGAVGRLDYLVSLSDLTIDGYRAHSEAENTQLNSRFRFNLDDRSELSLTISVSDQPISNDPGGLTIAEADANPRAARDRNLTFNAGEALDQQKLGLSFKRTMASGAVFAARNYYLFRDFRNRLPFTDGGVVVFDRIFAGGGVSYTQPFHLGHVQHRMITGIDYDRQHDDRQRFDNNNGVEGALAFDQDERVTSIGLFVQDEIKVSDELEVTLGLRYDNVDFNVADSFLADGNDSGSRSINDVSPSIGFVYVITGQHSVYGSIATAFETPTSTEFASPDGGGGFNPNLDPQKSSSYELGLRGELSKNSRYEIAAFFIDVDDELIPFEIVSSPGRNFFANAGKSHRRGLELAVNAEPMPGLNLSFAYTWSQFEFDEFIDDQGNDFSGNTTPGIPKSFAHADISYTHESGGFVAIDAMYSDQLFADNANSATVDGATLANLRFGFETTLGQLEMEPFIGINNLTDTTFTANLRINAFGGRFFEPGPDRNVYGGVSVRYIRTKEEQRSFSGHVRMVGLINAIRVIGDLLSCRKASNYSPTA